MQKLFDEVIFCDKAEKEKVADINLIISHAPKPGMIYNEQSSLIMLQSVVDAIRTTKDPFLVGQCFRVFDAWGVTELRTRFFTAEVVSALFQEDCANPIGTLTLLTNVMSSLKSCDHFVEIGLKVARNAANFIARHQNFSVLYEFCCFMIAFPECIPCGDNLFRCCESILNGICCLEELAHEENAVEKLTVIGGFLEVVWKLKMNQMVTVKCIMKILQMITSASESSISHALGAVVQFLPENLMGCAIKDLSEAHLTSDVHIKKIVSHLVDWLSWPRVLNISAWLMLLLQRMVEAGRYELLKQLTEKHVAVVCVSES